MHAGKAYPFKLTTPVCGLPDGYTPHGLAQQLLQVLGETKAEVHQRDDQGWVLCRRTDSSFASKTIIFNGAIKTPAALLVRPKNAQDVSRTVVFCRKRGLELSVKAGGFGVHGWSVGSSQAR